MKSLIVSGAVLFGAVVAPYGALTASACEAKGAQAANAMQLAGNTAGDAPITDPSVPGMGGSGGGVPGKSELNTGASDAANDDTDMDRDGDMDAYEGAMDDRSHDHGIKAGDAPAHPADRAREAGRGGTGADTQDLDPDHDPMR